VKLWKQSPNCDTHWTHACVDVFVVVFQAKIDESIRTLKLEVEMAVRQARGAVADKEKALVDHDVMKLVSQRGGEIMIAHGMWWHETGKFAEG